MRGVPVALALAMTLLLGAVVAPASAASSNQPAGDRISLFDGAQSFAANTAFHVDHGFLFENGVLEKAIGVSVFRLEVDGSPVAANFFQATHVDGFQLSKLWYFNFPAGKTGVHTFTGHWLSACDNDAVPCGGARINTAVEVQTLSATVTFS